MNRITLDYWYRYYGTTWLVDILYMFALTPLALVSFILNLASLHILLKSPFSSSIIFSYLRVYIGNSIILSVLLMTVFISNTYRIFDFTNTYGAIAYGAYIHTPATAIFYFNSTLLEILIIVERTLKFLPARFVDLGIHNHKKACVLAILLSLILNIPVFILYYPEWADVELDGKNIFRLYYWGLTEFQISLGGKVLYYMVYFIRDLVVLVVKIGLNITSVLMLRKYFNKIRVSSTAVNLKVMGQPVPEKVYLTLSEKNLIYMVIVMSVFSIFENIFYAFDFIYYSISPNEVSYGLFFLSFF